MGFESQMAQNLRCEIVCFGRGAWCSPQSLTFGLSVVWLLLIKHSLTSFPPLWPLPTVIKQIITKGLTRSTDRPTECKSTKLDQNPKVNKKVNLKSASVSSVHPFAHSVTYTLSLALAKATDRLTYS